MQLKYHNETVQDLHMLYKALFPEEEDLTWDLDVNSLKQVTMQTSNFTLFSLPLCAPGGV